MSEKYKKGDKLYEKPFFGEDSEIGTIKRSLFLNDWVETPTGGYYGKIESSLNDREHKITEQDNFFGESGFILTKEPFQKDWSYEEFDTSTKNEGISTLNFIIPHLIFSFDLFF
jgi:hypothetical protein